MGVRYDMPYKMRGILRFIDSGNERIKINNVTHLYGVPQSHNQGYGIMKWFVLVWFYFKI